MQLANIDIAKLSVSMLNMRAGKKAPDVSDILPSIRARGILVPLLVRPHPVLGEGACESPENYEIVAGRRRFYAAQIVAQEGGEADPLPCAIIEAGDDAAALEASLIENIARLDPDEVSQWETFTRLIRKEGRTIEQIGHTFGLTDLHVRRILALGNLLPGIRDLYRREEIDAHTIRHLTLASKAQQKEWLALFDDSNSHAPVGRQLKPWLLGGESISTKVALFPLDTYKGAIVADLFGDDGYFASADEFWAAQNTAIASKRDALIDDGWADVEIMEPGTWFHAYDHEKTPKAKGGKVFIAVRHSGEVEIHEGWLSMKEARKARAEAAKAGATEAEREAAQLARPEISSGLQRYIDLHRHAVARAVLADHPAVGLRLMVAHVITGSPLWTVRVEKQAVRNDAITESVETSAGEGRFDEKRRAVLALLGFSPDVPTVVGGAAEVSGGWHRYGSGTGDDRDTAALFAKLLALSDTDILAVVAIVMGETMAAGSAVVEAVGNHLKVDMAQLWTPDDAFFDLIRDRQSVNAILREVGGKSAADGNIAEKVKTQKGIIRDFLAGANDRKKVDGWVPKWLAFPAASYTPRPFATLAKWQAVAGHFKELPASAAGETGASQAFAIAAE